MYTYGISINQLNRDRDLVDDDTLSQKIREIWNKVNNSKLIQRYFEESSRIANGVISNKYKEFNYSLYPEWDVRHI